MTSCTKLASTVGNVFDVSRRSIMDLCFSSASAGKFNPTTVTIKLALYSLRLTMSKLSLLQLIVLSRVHYAVRPKVTDFGTNEQPMTDYSITVTYYILSCAVFKPWWLNFLLTQIFCPSFCTVSNISRSIGQIFAVDRGCLSLTYSLGVNPKFKTTKTSCQEAGNIALSYCEKYFDILNGSWVWLTDRRTDITVANTALTKLRGK